MALSVALVDGGGGNRIGTKRAASDASASRDVEEGEPSTSRWWACK